MLKKLARHLWGLYSATRENVACKNHELEVQILLLLQRIIIMNSPILKTKMAEAIVARIPEANS